MSTILNTIRWLSIFTGALSLFYLGHAWFEFGLAEVFASIYAWYAGMLHPVVELLKPFAVWLMGLFGWSLPVWWKDAVVLYLAMGGSTGRSRGAAFRDAEWRVKRAKEYNETGLEAFQALRRFARLQLLNFLGVPFKILAWPAVWIWELWLFLRRPYGHFSDPKTYWGANLSDTYMVSSVVEFSKILFGALIFAGLNAGLG